MQDKCRGVQVCVCECLKKSSNTISVGVKYFLHIVPTETDGGEEER